MELKSEPTYETVQVTDIDIAFPGDLQSYTLRDGVDKLVEDLEACTVTIVFGHGGTLRFNIAYAHWVGKKQRSIRVLVPEAQSGKSAAAPPPVSAG